MWKLFAPISTFPSSMAKYFVRTKSSVRIGCASGFWGDTATSTPQLIFNGNTDYIVYDYLSEITMGLLRKLRFVPDFVSHISPYLKDIKERNIKIVSNAGGLDPLKCAEQLHMIAEKSGLTDLKIAVITGDNVMDKIVEVREDLQPRDLDTNHHFPQNVLSMNAYIGAEPIAYALKRGADIVITGRCVDSAIVLGPLMHEYNWGPTQWDLLAQGSLAGHVLECGAQATGGICTDWRDVSGWDNIGFPIAEVYENGHFLVTKAPNTGGVVNIGTVSEQIVYEIGDPASYLLPDVTCDFRDVSLTATDDGVLVSGAVGRSANGSYKVCVIHLKEYRATAYSLIVGPNVREKGLKNADAIMKRVRRMLEAANFALFKEEFVQVFGCNDSYGGHAPINSEDLREGVLMLSCKHERADALAIFSQEVAPAGTGMSPGFTTLIGGRPKVTPVLSLFSYLTPKQNLKLTLDINGVQESIPVHVPVNPKDSLQPVSLTEPAENEHWKLTSGKLENLAYVRSGDKGNTVNIGVVARSPDLYSTLLNKLTKEKVFNFFKHKAHPNFEYKVYRYTLPGIRGMNFVLSGVLGGGALENMSPDPQGKAFGQMLAEMHLF